MNALIAVLITIGCFVALGVICTVLSPYWDKIVDAIFVIIFWIFPTPLMIYGVVTGNWFLAIVSEIVCCITSLLFAIADNLGLNCLIPAIPTIIFLIACIVLDQVTGAVILTLIALAQLGGIFES